MTDKTYQYLLLDWDGCLADSLEMWMEVYLDALRAGGIEPKREDVVREIFGNWQGAKNIGIEDLDAFHKDLLPLAIRGMQRVELFDGVMNALKIFKKEDKKMAIVTSSQRKIVEPAVKRLGLDKLIEFLLAAEDVDRVKPDPEMVYKALDILGGDREEAMIVGDSDKDVGAGKNAKIATAIFYPKQNEGFYGLEDLEELKADYLFTDFRELVTLVK